MQVYNTLTRKKEEFIPIEEGKVSMYVCGPTVYDYIHIGNARPLVVFDTLHRYLKYKGYEVRYVVNFTDIDDKIINRAKEENTSYQEITDRYIQAFTEQAEELNLLESETIHPRATHMIPQMVSFIEGLVNKGAAYDGEDAVYFRVEASEDYGKLSRKNIDELKIGARIEENKDKDNPVDFTLWKKKKEEYEPSWESPWGQGRPGWHIECSTMAKEILGETIDIHAGGADLQFPHHENEIAQSETLNDKTFANYWMHNSMITVTSDQGEEEKMSKSKGNFWTLHDISKEYDLILVRLWLLSAHYRSPINFSHDVMEQTKNAYHRLMTGKANMERLSQHTPSRDLSQEEVEVWEELLGEKQAFIHAMDDDLNTADALAAIYDMLRIINTKLDESSSKKLVDKALNLYEELLGILGIRDTSQEEILDEEIEALIQERSEARAEKNFARADEIRDLLADQGIILKDTPTGVVWSRE